jgi:hypothetical protein
MFTPRKINFSEINGGARYVDGNEVSPEAINRPIEASAYAQDKAEEAITKANIAMEKVNDSEIGEITLSAYPIGSIYMSINSTSPAVLFGGTWEAITGRFLLGSGTALDNNKHDFGDLNNANYIFTSGDMGGQYNHKLTVNEMPKHKHNLAGSYTTTTNTMGSTSSASNGWIPLLGGTTYQSSLPIIETGGDGAHHIMNPYYVVNIWKRIA